MLSNEKTQIWAALATGLVLVAGTAAFIIWQKKQPISLRGAVMVQDADPRKQVPIAGVEVSTGNDLARLPATSDASGFFVVKLRKPIRRGHPIALQFSHPQYRSLNLNTYVQDKLYIVYLAPLSAPAPSPRQPLVRVGNIRVRYTDEALTELNVGSAVRTFEVRNKGNVPCKGQHPCSPDGMWKAALGSGSLDAGPGNAFREARTSCIAGPCPFTKIESQNLSKSGQTITVSARDWSDTATFLLEAEVFRPMVSQTEHWSYPVLFGDWLSFTLPAGAQSVSIEADLDGQTIIFPLGPLLHVDWATCDSEGDRARVYRCVLKPGYRFG